MWAGRRAVQAGVDRLAGPPVTEDQRGAGLSTAAALSTALSRHAVERRCQARGTTPLPAVASARRREGPSVAMRWAGWRGRSTLAGGRGLGLVGSKPGGGGGVEVAGDGHAALLVGGVDHPVEGLGGVLTAGQHADVIDHDEL